jgi:hypothetical protein
MTLRLRAAAIRVDSFQVNQPFTTTANDNRTMSAHGAKRTFPLMTPRTFAG